jgi:hypothetical protein
VLYLCHKIYESVYRVIQRSSTTLKEVVGEVFGIEYVNKVSSDALPFRGYDVLRFMSLILL